MLTVTQEFLDTVDTSHQENAEVTVDGEIIPISAGSVTLDAGAVTFGALRFTVADQDMLAVDETDLILPFGSEAQVRFGIRTPSGWEWVTVDCSFLVVETPRAAGVLSGHDVICESNVVRVQDDRFLTPWQSPGGSAQALLTALLTGTMPGATVTFDTGDRTVEATVYERERWEAVTALADSLGGWVQPTLAGFAVRDNDPDSTVVWQVAHGVNLLEGTKPSVRRDSRYNGCVAYNPDDPDVWALATEDDPTSVTRWDGPMGRRPLFYASPLLDAATVDAAAASRLATANGKSLVYDLTVLQNPAIQPGDVIQVTWHDKTVDTVVVRKVEFSLTPGPMKLTVQGVTV